MARLIQVMYTVPVACLIDMEAEEIVAVTVIDEDITRDEGRFVDGAGDEVPASQETARAQEIAEAPDAFWPPWNFGY